MARLATAAGTFPLIAGIAAATALTGAAVFTVVRSGCEDPGAFRTRNGAVELIGGCIKPEDLPIAPHRPAAPVQPPAEDAHAGSPVPRQHGQPQSAAALLRR